MAAIGALHGEEVAYGLLVQLQLEGVSQAVRRTPHCGGIYRRRRRRRGGEDRRAEHAGRIAKIFSVLFWIQDGAEKVKRCGPLIRFGR